MKLTRCRTKEKTGRKEKGKKRGGKKAKSKSQKLFSPLARMHAFGSEGREVYDL